jgi:ferritin-like metal-binding protein YciE
LTETERQKERLEARLAALGGTSNKLKDFINKIGIAATDLLHGGKDPGDKATRNLIQAYSIENLEVAVYESLYAAATQVGDTQTAALAKEIQAEEEATARKIFPRIAPVAMRAVSKASNPKSENCFKKRPPGMTKPGGLFAFGFRAFIGPELPTTIVAAGRSTRA